MFDNYKKISLITFIIGIILISTALFNFAFIISGRGSLKTTSIIFILVTLYCIWVHFMSFLNLKTSIRMKDDIDKIREELWQKDRNKDNNLDL